jgi:2-(1,2-epoxy-1,2-dihydrophenyl)acetyl-CoA isomerase
MPLILSFRSDSTNQLMQNIIFTIEGAVAIIRLNRPDKLNAFTREMAFEMQQCLDEAASLKEVRAVLITGTGKGFSAGQDLAEITEPGGPTMAQILSEHYNPIIRKIRSMAKPVIAAVNGVAAGAGANIALCCDIVLACHSASFVQAFSKIGLIPDSGGTFFLPRLIGWQKASALMMTGDKISATEAETMGMIYQVIADDQFEEKIRQFVSKIAAMPTHGLALTKHALNYSLSSNYEGQLILEDELQQKAALTYDYREGVESFIQKRPPQFKGE